MITVIFIEPETSGNAGALARVMKNFGYTDLIIVNPQCNVRDDECKGRAKHAYDVIQKARILPSFEKAIQKYDFVIGTTGKTTQDYSEIRTTITPAELRGQLSKNPDASAAIVFGRESTGLTNDELEKCSITVHIPTHHKYPVMNITHAAAVILYELSSAKESKYRKAGADEKNALFSHADRVIQKLDKIRDKKTVSKIFKNVVNRSMIATQEAHTLAGLFSEIRKKVK